MQVKAVFAVPVFSAVVYRKWGQIMLTKKYKIKSWRTINLYLGEGCVCCSGYFCGCM